MRASDVVEFSPPRRRRAWHGSGSGGEDETFSYVASMGCRCSQARLFQVLGKRRCALPFDWIFSSAAMVTDCLRDDFRAFLDRSQYFLNAVVHDSIGLPPGSRPRDRHLIGHRRYSEMMKGVGRGTIFNHRNPMSEAKDREDYCYYERCVERFRSILQAGDRKLFAIMNLNSQLWLEDDIRALWQELCRCSRNFLLIAVDCMKNIGERARAMEVETLAEEVNGDRRMLLYRLPCIDDNTGSYFRNSFDEERMRSLVIDPYRFALVDDPLDRQCLGSGGGGGGGAAATVTPGVGPGAPLPTPIAAEAAAPATGTSPTEVTGISGARRWNRRRRQGAATEPQP